jgi:hypothetical protein
MTHHHITTEGLTHTPAASASVAESGCGSAGTFDAPLRFDISAANNCTTLTL